MWAGACLALLCALFAVTPAGAESAYRDDQHRLIDADFVNVLHRAGSTQLGIYGSFPVKKVFWDMSYSSIFVIPGLSTVTRSMTHEALFTVVSSGREVPVAVGSCRDSHIQPSSKRITCMDFAFQKPGFESQCQYDSAVQGRENATIINQSFDPQDPVDLIEVIPATYALHEHRIC
ncbi:hypothetical protein NHL50_13410 [Acidimicrobiia bacterium EGI L10123]|uniref:hypothetical protein n=1 Tax=Salinilacustrithrix flava TaxID=2957203 RepID=UPI003D7C2137|nr:hypothetical protein [Acidimicrobiia bacterium EGI L10123]